MKDREEIQTRSTLNRTMWGIGMFLGVVTTVVLIGRFITGRHRRR